MSSWYYASRKRFFKILKKMVFFTSFWANIMKFVSIHSGNNIWIFHKNTMFSVFLYFFIILFIKTFLNYLRCWFFTSPNNRGIQTVWVTELLLNYKGYWVIGTCKLYGLVRDVVQGCKGPPEVAQQPPELPWHPRVVYSAALLPTVQTWLSGEGQDPWFVLCVCRLMSLMSHEAHDKRQKRLKLMEERGKSRTTVEWHC